MGGWDHPRAHGRPHGKGLRRCPRQPARHAGGPRFDHQPILPAAEIAFRLRHTDADIEQADAVIDLQRGAQFAIGELKSGLGTVRIEQKQTQIEGQTAFSHGGKSIVPACLPQNSLYSAPVRLIVPHKTNLFGPACRALT